jgi:arylsulfatase A-like enzyme
MPFIVRWPGRVKAGSESNALISQIDLIADLAKLTKQSLAAGAAPDSQEMLSVLLGKSTDGRKDLVEQGYDTFGYRHGNWKLVLDKTGKHLELYNLANDIAEQHNLAAQQPAKVKELQAQLQRIKGNDTQPLNSNSYSND